MLKRDIRFQGAIVKDGRVLLIRHAEHDNGRTYWLFPGGGKEYGESDHECVCREMREETGLEVRVDGLLFDEPYTVPGTYERRRMYLCTPIAGEAAPGYEPEVEASSVYGIVEVRWVSVTDEAEWGEMSDDPFTGPELRRLRASLADRSTNDV